MISLFSCPVCGKALDKSERIYKCENGHCFDMAKEGYVNLASGSTKVSGDDKDMVRARTRFLDGGYYENLRNTLCSLIEKTNIDCPVILDSGCGEGYYLSAFESMGKAAGIDLSKSAVRHAAKRCKNAEVAAASVFRIPLCDSSVNILVNCFSPLALDEFLRVLKKDGYLLYVVPGKKHLWELKSILYDNPYENEEKTEHYDGFEYMGKEHITNVFSLNSGEDIQALYHMTPYTWKTPKDGAKRLSKVSSLDVTSEFHIHIYMKK